VRALLVAALIGLAAALMAPTANAAACWQRVLDDWRDGHLDGVYAPHCYRDALRNLPEDLRVYGSAETDIQGALARALARSANHPRRAVRVAVNRTTTSAGAAAPPASTPAPERRHTRTLAGHSATQPKLRLAAAATGDRGASGFPLAAVVAGAAALGAAVVLLASLHRRAQRRPPH
jgi:hypothetical protein